MPADVESMAYKFESRVSVPWHGLGTSIDHESTPQEMLVAAGLDWTVSKRPTYCPVDKDGEGLMTVDDFFALVRDSDNKVLGPAGKEYVPTQNAQAFSFFKKFTEAGHMSMDTAGSLQGGKQVWALAKLNKRFTIMGEDEVEGYLLFSSPHVWGKSLVIKFTAIRVVCANTFAMAMNEAKYGRGFRMPHIRAFDAEVAKEAETSLGIATELFEGFEATANLLAKTKVTKDVVVRYIADVYQPEMMVATFGKGYKNLSEAKQAELILSPNSPQIDPMKLKKSAHDAHECMYEQPAYFLESTKETMWGCFNAVTYHCDHIAGLSRDNSLQSSWFGAKAALKTAALKRAVQVAQVAR